MRSPFVGGVLFLVLLLGASPCGGATWLVAPDGSGMVPTIQAAIQAAAPGDTVALADGVFTGSGNRDVVFLGKAIVLQSQSGNPEACVVDAQASRTQNHRCFLFQGGEGPGTILESITVRNGWVELSSCGGGVLCGENSAPTIRNCIFTGNYGYNGGGLGVGLGAHPTVLGCRFIRNRGADYGGGIGADQFGSGPVTVKDCRFEDNETWWHGGGVAVAEPSYFENCTFAGNRSSMSGGAFFHCGPGRTVFQRCTFFQNTATEVGGAGTT
jgi:hypothetical protein